MAANYECAAAGVSTRQSLTFKVFLIPLVFCSWSCVVVFLVLNISLHNLSFYCRSWLYCGFGLWLFQLVIMEQWVRILSVLMPA